jgi:predicted NBD/HSP70 family sugar kinase
VVRVWHLGDGVGFGRYPRGEGVWEPGHAVVTLDPKERYCGCGGQGHLESIVGYRAMRLRFLDLEPEEVFAAARAGEPRATEFVKLWHRALAAATATIVHLDGPGRFYLAGPLADFVDPRRLGMELQDMVKMSPLQGSYFETVPTSHDLALIGAGVTSGME